MISRNESGNQDHEILIGFGTMANASGAPDRGRPPRVTAEGLARAVLEIRGHEPTLAELADRLEVGRATLYSHVRGQRALRQFAQNALLEDWDPESAEPGTHWAVWARAYASQIRAKLADYPYLADVMSGTRSDLPGQVKHTERVMARLVELGLEPGEAFLLLRCLIVMVVGLHAQPWGGTTHDPEQSTRFESWVRTHPDPLPTLIELLDAPNPSRPIGGNGVFDILLGFLLRGFAERRGEVLDRGFAPAPGSERAKAP
jgi:hypothetical protein